MPGINKKKQKKDGNKMSKKLHATLVGAAALAAIAGTSHADIDTGSSLLGKNYIGGAFSITKFGDDILDDVFGESYDFTIRGNINIAPNLDLHLAFSYAWADGDESAYIHPYYVKLDYELTGYSGAANLVYFFDADDVVTPYVGAGVGVAKQEVEVKASILGYSESEDEDDTNFGFTLCAGIDIEPVDKMLIRTGLDFLHIDSENYVTLGLSLGYWFSEQALGSIGCAYEFDQEDTTATIGLVIKL